MKQIFYLGFRLNHKKIKNFNISTYLASFLKIFLEVIRVILIAVLSNTNFNSNIISVRRHCVQSLMSPFFRCFGVIKVPFFFVLFIQFYLFSMLLVCDLSNIAILLWHSVYHSVLNNNNNNHKNNKKNRNCTWGIIQQLYVVQHSHSQDIKMLVSLILKEFYTKNVQNKR